MILKTLTGLCALAVLAVPAAAPAFGPAAAPQPRSDRAGEEERPSTRRPAPELICRSVAIAGADESMPMVCMSAEDWRREMR